MFKRYPYTIGLMAVISFIVCIVWLFTHDACMHPFAIVEEQGDEQ